jgi:hypothetical protein
MGYINSKKYDGVQLYKKANGDISYYVRYKDENLKIVRVKIGDKSKGITEHFCNQKRNEILNKIRLGEDIPIRQNKRKGITVDEVFNKYLEYLKFHSTASSIKEITSKYTTHYKEPFGNKAIESITTKELEKLQKRR